VPNSRVNGVGGLALQGGGDAGVDVEGRAHGLVAEPLLDNLGLGCLCQ
jgi:hypothetical protein